MRILLPIPLVIAVAVATGLLVFAALDVSAHPREMVLAALICTLAGEVALIPLLLTRGAAQPAVAQAGLVGTVVHLFTSAALGGAAMLVKPLRLDQAYVYWLLALYWISLIVLVTLLVRAVKAAAIRTGLT